MTERAKKKRISTITNGGKTNTKNRFLADGDSVAESGKKSDWLIGGLLK